MGSPPEGGLRNSYILRRFSKVRLSAAAPRMQRSFAVALPRRARSRSARATMKLNARCSG